MKCIKENVNTKNVAEEMKRQNQIVFILEKLLINVYDQQRQHTDEQYLWKLKILVPIIRVNV